MSPDTFGEGGLIIGWMFCLRVEGPIVGVGGGGSGGSRPSDKRGGGHPVPEKKGEAISKKIRGGGWGNAKLRVSIRSDLEPRVVRIRTCGYWEAC